MKNKFTKIFVVSLIVVGVFSYSRFIKVALENTEDGPVNVSKVKARVKRGPVAQEEMTRQNEATEEAVARPINNPGNAALPGEEVIADDEVQLNPSDDGAQISKSMNDQESGSGKVPFLKRGASLSFSPFYSFATISAKDSSGATSTYASQYYTGFDISYIKKWSPLFRTLLNLKFALITFGPPNNNSRNIVEGRKFLSGIGVGAGFDLTSRLNLEVTATYQKVLYARSRSTQDITVDSVAIPIVGGKLSYDLVHLNPFTLGVSSSINFEFPKKMDDYNIKSGALYNGIIYLRQFLNDKNTSSFQAELDYGNGTRETSITKQSQFDLTLRTRFFFPFGG